MIGSPRLADRPSSSPTSRIEVAYVHLAWRLAAGFAESSWQCNPPELDVTRFRTGEGMLFAATCLRGDPSDPFKEGLRQQDA